MRLVLCQIINVILHVHTLLKGSIYGCSLDVGMSLIYIMQEVLLLFGSLYKK